MFSKVRWWLVYRQLDTALSCIQLQGIVEKELNERIEQLEQRLANVVNENANLYIRLKQLEAGK